MIGLHGEPGGIARPLNLRTGSVRGGRQDFEPSAQVEGTLTGEVGLRCQLTHRPQRKAWRAQHRAVGTTRRPRVCKCTGFTSPLRIRYVELTANGDSQVMRTLATTLTALIVLAFAGTALGGGRAPVPPFPRLPGTWSHAEINVSIKKTPHTLILDRGRIVQVSALQVTLREPDGTTVVVPLSSSTLVVIGGVPSTTFDLRKRMNAQTMRIDGGAAVRLRVIF
jgi:hypothetical protein